MTSLQPKPPSQSRIPVSITSRNNIRNSSSNRQKQNNNVTSAELAAKLQNDLSQKSTTISKSVKQQTNNKYGIGNTSNENKQLQAETESMNEKLLQLKQYMNQQKQQRQNDKNILYDKNINYFGNGNNYINNIVSKIKHKTLNNNTVTNVFNNAEAFYNSSNSITKPSTQQQSKSSYVPPSGNVSMTQQHKQRQQNNNNIVNNIQQDNNVNINNSVNNKLNNGNTKQLNSSNNATHNTQASYNTQTADYTDEKSNADSNNNDFTTARQQFLDTLKQYDNIDDNTTTTSSSKEVHNIDNIQQEYTVGEAGSLLYGGNELDEQQNAQEFEKARLEFLASLQQSNNSNNSTSDDTQSSITTIQRPVTAKTERISCYQCYKLFNKTSNTISIDNDMYFCSEQCMNKYNASIRIKCNNKLCTNLIYLNQAIKQDDGKLLCSDCDNKQYDTQDNNNVNDENEVEQQIYNNTDYNVDTQQEMYDDINHNDTNDASDDTMQQKTVADNVSELYEDDDAEQQEHTTVIIDNQQYDNIQDITNNNNNGNNQVDGGNIDDHEAVIQHDNNHIDNHISRPTTQALLTNSRPTTAKSVLQSSSRPTTSKSVHHDNTADNNNNTVDYDTNTASTAIYSGPTTARVIQASTVETLNKPVIEFPSDDEDD